MKGDANDGKVLSILALNQWSEVVNCVELESLVSILSFILSLGDETFLVLEYHVPSQYIPILI